MITDETRKWDVAQHIPTDAQEYVLSAVERVANVHNSCCFHGAQINVARKCVRYGWLEYGEAWIQGCEIDSDEFNPDRFYPAFSITAAGRAALQRWREKRSPHDQ